jgi:tight adherence protein B
MTILPMLAAVLALSGGLILWLTLGDLESRRVRHRLAVFTGDAGHMAPSSPLAGLHVAALDQRFEMLGWNAPRVLLAAAGGLALLFALILLLEGLVCASLATILAVTGLVKGLDIMAARARTRFADDLPLLVDRLRQLIIAGNGTTLAFSKALRTCPPHMARLLAPVAAALAHGMPLADGLHQRAARLASPDLFLLAAIVRISTQFGGDFSAALAHFEAVLANRVRSRREIRALTSELRMTTYILLSLPLVAATGIFFASPGYIEFFVTSPQGPAALLYVGGSIAIGVALVSRLSRIEY